MDVVSFSKLFAAKVRASAPEPSGAAKVKAPAPSGAAKVKAPAPAPSAAAKVKAPAPAPSAAAGPQREKKRYRDEPDGGESHKLANTARGRGGASASGSRGGTGRGDGGGRGVGDDAQGGGRGLSGRGGRGGRGRGGFDPAGGRGGGGRGGGGRGFGRGGVAARPRDTAPPLDPETLSRVISANNAMARCAQHKQLAEARAIFEQLVGAGTCNRFSYTIFLNACARCDDVSGATATLALMRPAGFAPDVVAFTTVLKAHCARGDVAASQALLLEMAAQTPPVRPNVRAANTFLRGCLLAGAVDEGIGAFRRMRQHWHAEADVSSVEAAVALLCQALRLEEAAALAAQYATLVRAEPAVPLALARAAALLGEWAGCEAHAAAALSALAVAEADAEAEAEAEAGDGGGDGGGSSADEDASRPAAGGAPSASASAKPQSVKAKGGKRAWREESEPLARAASNLAYRSARRDGQRADAEALRLLAAQAGPKPDLASGFRRLLLCRQLGAACTDAKRSARALARAACTFGLRGTQAEERLRVHFKSHMSARGQLRLPRLFAQPLLPLRAELCSGTGEWACAQAGASLGRANWLAVEWRADRTHATFARAALGKLGNLAVVCADAGALLAERVPAGALDALFVNHPEPPQQAGRSGAAAGGAGAAPQGRHLLTAAFFETLWRALRVGGTLTVVSDSEWYASLLLRTVGGLGPSCPFGSVDLAGAASKLTEHARAGAIVLHQGRPGSECGHEVAVRSYFDRLWDQSHKTSRYVLCLRKEAGPSEAGPAAGEA